MRVPLAFVSFNKVDLGIAVLPQAELLYDASFAIAGSRLFEADENLRIRETVDVGC